MVKMKNIEEHIEEFKKFGVSERETRIYLALLEHGELKANELQRIIGLSRAKVYSVLSAMQDYGLVKTRKAAKGQYYIASSPGNVLKILKRKWKQTDHTYENNADEIKKLISDHFPGTDTIQTLNPISLVRNRIQIHRHFIYLSSQTTKCVNAFSRTPYSVSSVKAAEEQFEVQREALKRGVKMRTVYSRNHMPDPNIEIEIFHENDQMRIVDNLPIKMFIFDSEVVLLAVPSTPEGNVNNFSMVVVEDPGFAELCESTFEVYWSMAEPVDVIKSKSLETKR